MHAATIDLGTIANRYKQEHELHAYCLRCAVLRWM